MLSTQSAPSKQMSSQESNASQRSFSGLNPQTPSFVPSSPLRPPGTATEALDQWFDNFSQHEVTLEAMAAASTDQKFQEELGTIEQWFKVLSEAERTASVYTLLQHSNQTQIRFFIAVLQQMLRASEGAPLSAAVDVQQTNKNPRSLRPPSLNLPMPRSPGTPQFSAAPMSAALSSAVPDSATGEKSKLGQIAESAEQDVVVKPVIKDENSWASMVNTPLGNMFPKGSAAVASPKVNGFDGKSAGVGGVQNFPASMAMMNGFPNMNMMGVSQEAQLLAMQLVMSGMVQPGMPLPQQLQNLQQKQQGNKQQRGHQKTPSSGQSTNNWRSPASGRYPRSALKSAGIKSPLKSAGLSSAGLKSASSMGSTGSPRDEEVDPELLKDVPAWLKSLRLHKYTPSFEGMTWEEMVVLDDAALEKKGVAALGARRRLLRTFDNVRKKMGMDPPSTADGLESAGPPIATFAQSDSMPSIASVTEPIREAQASPAVDAA